MTKNKKLFCGSFVLWVLGTVLFVCFIFPLMCWYLPLDPVSPPPTLLNTVPSFDAVLADANKNGLFLFETKGKIIITTDIYGQNEEVLFDIETATHSNQSYILTSGWDFSPNKKYVPIFYATANYQVSDPPDNLVMFDIEEKTVISIPTELEGYKLDGFHPIRWLSPSVFLVKMYTHINKGTHWPEIIKFIRYDMQDITKLQIIEIYGENPTMAYNYDTRVLILSDTDTNNKRVINTIDINGKRLATLDERKYLDCFRYPDCNGHNSVNNNIPDIRVEPVIDETDGFGRYYSANWDRYYIYLDDNLVRISDGETSGPVWHSDLELFIWQEQFNTYVMDTKGHYRLWYVGTYLEKLPKNTR